MVTENRISMEHELCLEQNKDCSDTAMCISFTVSLSKLVKGTL